MIRYEDIPRDFNLTTFFLDRNVEEGRGDRVALTGDATVTYAELAALANRAGNVLSSRRAPRDRVLLALSDGAAFLAWYGALKIGAVVAEVYTFLPVKDYAYFLRYTARASSSTRSPPPRCGRRAATCAFPCDPRRRPRDGAW